MDASQTTTAHRSLLWQGLILGVTGFGGPVAHLALFHRRFVEELGWLSAERYAQLLALSQALPGPSSSQVCFLVGHERRGLIGGLTVFAGFASPSAIALMLAGYLVVALEAGGEALPVIGLKAAAAGVVIHALNQMARRFCEGLQGVVIALSAGLAIVYVDHPLMVPGVILLLAASALWRRQRGAGASGPPVAWARPLTGIGIASVIVIASLVTTELALPPEVSLLVGLGQGGALVFGGGHVVLPLLEGFLVPGVMDQDRFLAGYGLAQAVPGPMFTLSAYLGTVTGGPLLGLAAVAVIFLPGFALVWGLLPVWDRLMAGQGWRAGLARVNAGVVGLVGAALYDPVLPASLVSMAAAAAVALTVLALMLRVPVWLVVGAVGAGLPLLA